jgi:hypothetical protein
MKVLQIYLKGLGINLISQLLESLVTILVDIYMQDKCFICGGVFIFPLYTSVPRKINYEKIET